MANSLLNPNDTTQGPAKPAPGTDTRVFMYKGREARMFASPDDVPKGEGWRDAPYDEAPETPKAKRKAKTEDVSEIEVDGDSD